MGTCYNGGDAAENLLERRWFAANSAAGALRAECEVLREVIELAEASLSRARAELNQLEMLRDALGEDLAAFYQRDAVTIAKVSNQRVSMSAA